MDTCSLCLGSEFWNRDKKDISSEETSKSRSIFKRELLKPRKGLLSVNYRQKALRIFRDLGKSDLVKCKADYMAARNLDTRR